MLRRTFLRSGGAAADAAFAGSPWHGTAPAGSGGGPTRQAPRVRAGDSPYGPLGAPDANGISLPAGFTSRIVARSGEKVGGLTWHAAPDGGACFPDGDGWIYVSNCEVPLLGGASAIRFGPGGEVREAYRILSGTDLNRAGGATPWHTWLSCEEIPRGQVFECDPYGGRAAMPRLAMGRFRHEAAACDPERRVIYMTEDEPDGCFYRFVPIVWGDLTEGRLEVLCDPVGTGPGAKAAPGPVSWEPVPSPAAIGTPARHQVPRAVHFAGGEGCHYAGGICYFTSGGDNRVWAYDAAAGMLEIVYDGDAPLRGVDDITGTRGGDLFVAETGGLMEIGIISREGVVAPFLRVTGQDRSQITGTAFSPDGSRLYFSSRRGPSGAREGTGGITYEVTGPFRD
ncbi:hypothetical protein HNP84_009519 [Thermocatellispora tengchongensis]|uniref:Translocation protein TolB n=1 Tax=Thermocatellispora tengchongensis TaxID=1073253 RepID=A0A840PV36_9ACTN|nr:alkaline phosphatase PhoX [Thermocatellispora tengchongensis]MBB5139755.1 hypothetical protein [Thermocatellispora tengchongensis]